MKKETVPAKKSEKTVDRTAEIARARGEFLSAALSMSWQLAVVVLLPLLGGHALDNHFRSSPVWTIVGFVIAVLLGGVVVWRSAQLASPNPKDFDKHKESKR
jgi:F0F1-type ATP synthase assembly protein I